MLLVGTENRNYTLKRLWAFIFDLVIFCIIIGASGYLLHPIVGALGQMPERLISIILLVGYHGILNSSLCGGQTLGKRIFKIKVVKESGGYLSLGQSLVRSAVLLAPFLLNRLDLSATRYPLIVGIQTVVVFGFPLMHFLCLIFNQRHSLHDYLFSTRLVHKNAEEYKGQHLIARAEWKTIAMMIVVFVGFTVSSAIDIHNHSVSKITDDVSKSLYTKLNSIDGVLSAGFHSSAEAGVPPYMRIGFSVLNFSQSELSEEQSKAVWGGSEQPVLYITLRVPHFKNNVEIRSQVRSVVKEAFPDLPTNVLVVTAIEQRKYLGFAMVSMESEL
jgi:uncharacterized RDD family membrane protein YckC